MGFQDIGTLAKMTRTALKAYISSDYAVSNDGFYSELTYVTSTVGYLTDGGWIDSLITKATSFSNFSTLATFQNLIGEAVRPLSYIIAMMFFIIALVELGSSDRMNLDMFIKFFAKLGCAFFLIENSDYMLQFASGVEQALNEAVASLSATGDAGADLIQTVIDSAPTEWYTRVMQTIPNLLGGLAEIVAFGFILTTLLSRLMELTVRGAFMPIAFAFVTEEGWRGTAIRYFKKYIALLATGPMISVIFKMGKSLSASLMEGLGDYQSIILHVGLNVIIAIAEVGMIKRGSEIMNDVFGC